MADLRIETNLPQVLKQLERIEPRQWPFVLSKALNEAAFKGRGHLKNQLPKFVDRPVPYTLSAIRVQKATKQNVESEIFWQRSGARVSGGQYLRPQVFGGAREPKGFERVLSRKGLIPTGYVLVPTPDVERDNNGNIPRRLINAILRALDAVSEAETRRRYDALIKRKGIARGVRDIVKAKPRRPRREKYFFIPLTDRSMPPGMYERRDFGGLGVGKRRLFAIRKQANYQSRFPFFEIMNAKAESVFPQELDKAIDFALATSR